MFLLPSLPRGLLKTLWTGPQPSLGGGGGGFGGGGSYFLWCVTKSFPSCSTGGGVPNCNSRRPEQLMPHPEIKSKDITAEIQREVATGVVWWGKCGGGGEQRKLQNTCVKGRHPTPSKGTESGPAGRLPSAGGGSSRGQQQLPFLLTQLQVPFLLHSPAQPQQGCLCEGQGPDGVAQGHLHAGWGVGVTWGPSTLTWAMAGG